MQLRISGLGESPAYRDIYGNPLLRITFNRTDNERKMVRYVAEAALTPTVTQLAPTTQHVDDTVTHYSIVPYQSTHCNGGTIMGDDPSTSVVNNYCQTWDMPNLFVVGASN